MKLKLFIPLFVLLVFGCNVNRTSSAEKKLQGEWKGVEQYLSIGGPTDWKPLESEILLKFTEDNKFVETIQNAQRKGTYVEEKDQVVLTFEFGNPSTLTYRYRWEEDGHLILGNAACIEPCELKYKRIR